MVPCPELVMEQSAKLLYVGSSPIGISNRLVVLVVGTFA